MKTKRSSSIWLLMVALAGALACSFFAGCTTQQSNETQAREDTKLSIVCSIFPAYDFAHNICGDNANVTLLLPPGADIHSYEPTPFDIAEATHADVFVYMGEVSDPWAEDIVESLPDSVLVIDLSEGITKLADEHEHEHEGEESEEEEEEHAGHHHHEYDPHMWLDLERSEQMISNLASALAQVDTNEDHAEAYASNASAYNAKLAALDKKFQALFEQASTNTLVFGGRFAYSYFLDRYGLEAVTIYDSCSDETEPSVSQMADVIDYINENDVEYIYYEELTVPRVAEAVAEECEIKTLQFSIGHNLTQEQFDQGMTFLDIMQSNYDNLAKGLL